ncbi:hypothetical protein C8R44DRAFT_785360 [Mycena epipterygia]|nr:hypothetical protein C8R44DRAFT_785360 [Mycena epipterygia]
MAPVVIPGINVPLLTGPLVLGYMWSYCLYGMLLVQVYMYSEAFAKDRRGIKIIVWSMFTFETVFTIFTTIAAWNAYGPGWGDTDTLLIIDWAWEPLPALNGVLAAMAQSFYIWRIYSLTRKLWLPIIIACIMLTQLTMAFYYGIVVSIEGRGVDKLFALSPEVTVWLVGSAACDILITLSLVFILSRQRRTAGFQRTTSVINKLIRFSVETGSVTSVGALIEVILWLTCRQWNLHFIFFLILGKLYSNMLMATLNCRAPMFNGENNTFAIQTSFWADKSTAQGSGSRGVHISHTTNTSADPDTIVMGDFNTDTSMHGKGLGSRDKTSHLVM